jgi:hypothetical protein
MPSGEELKRLGENLIKTAGHADREMTDFALARLRGDSREMIELAKYLVGFGNDALSGFRQADFPLGSMKELDAQVFLELADLLAQGRLTDIEANCRAAEVQLFRQSHERSQMPEFHEPLNRGWKGTEIPNVIFAQ